MNLDAEPILGPAFVGSSVATFLLGLITVQTYIYYRDYSNDPLGIKLFVAAVWLSEVTNQICASWTLYYYSVKEYGNWLFVVIRAPLSFDLFILFHGWTILLVSAFYIYRLWYATDDRTIAALLGTFMFIRSAIVIVIAGDAYRKGSWLAFLTGTKTLLTISMSIMSVTQMLLTIVLCYDLNLRRHSALYKKWDFVHRTVVWIFGTGLFTSLLTIAMTISFLMNLDKVIWLGIFITLSRFVCISFLLSMNARGGFQHHLKSSSSSSTSDYDLANEAQNGHGFSSKASKAAELRVVVRQETSDNSSRGHSQFFHHNNDNHENEWKTGRAL